MAKQKSGPVELGGEMDYSEHDKTYGVFITGTKYGTLACVALLIGMAVGFYTSGGFLAGLATFIVSMFVGRIIMNKII
ncbi:MULTISPECIES: aa3-type cytochrome c oxidase subunit IV [unclassified Lentilitoribacter]|uniref:aa3-type cytochrome c oxidase subunit IV n=1 Tax=unclassified Lentilitoribacter TaxID=2647570 RepID=UPI0013A6C9B5|nr:aa3-type cytochrome c oxidase subunit IV [Lentilitoribacter sp. Alg239-R112]